MKTVFKTTVRRHLTPLGEYGRIISKKLTDFINEDVVVTVESGKKEVNKDE